MSEPFDYMSFLNKLSDECDRLKEVYSGKTSDAAMNPAFVLDTFFTKYLNNFQIPMAAKVIYGNAYDHMRAYFRALKLSSFSREDFYTFAQEDMDKQKALYEEKRRITSKNILPIMKNLQEKDAQTLQGSEDGAKRFSEKFELDLKQQMAVPEDISLNKEIILDFDAGK